METKNQVILGLRRKKFAFSDVQQHQTTEKS